MLGAHIIEKLQLQTIRTLMRYYVTIINLPTKEKSPNVQP